MTATECRWAECHHDATDDDDGECGRLHCDSCYTPIESGEKWYDVLREDVRSEAVQTYGGGVGYPTDTYCRECAKEAGKRYVMDSGIAE